MNEDALEDIPLILEQADVFQPLKSQLNEDAQSNIRLILVQAAVFQPLKDLHSWNIDLKPRDRDEVRGILSARVENDTPLELISLRTQSQRTPLRDINDLFAGWYFVQLNVKPFTTPFKCTI